MTVHKFDNSSILVSPKPKATPERCDSPGFFVLKFDSVRKGKALDKTCFARYNRAKGGTTMPKIDAQLGIRVTKDLKARLTAQAKSEMKSVSTLVVQVMEAYLESKGNGKKD